MERLRVDLIAGLIKKLNQVSVISSYKNKPIFCKTA